MAVTLGESELKNKEKKSFEVVQFEVTNKCNMNCPHCFKYDSNENGLHFNGFMTKETVNKFFDSGVDMICLLNFSGGEPLLNVDTIIYTLDKIMQEKRTVMQIDIRTNGTILSEPLINKLNEYSEYLYNDLYKRLENFPDKYKEDKETGNYMVNIQISVPFHNSDGQRAYKFYSERAKNVRIEIQEDTESEVHKMDYETDKDKYNNIKRLAYSGRAKNINAEFFVDSPCHKVVYSAPHLVKCPILILYDGTVTISAYCTHSISCGVGKMGNVHSGMFISEMIKKWNYDKPLTCEEVCELEKFKMWKETGHIEDLLKYKKAHNESVDMTIEEANKAMDKIIKQYEYIEDFRKHMHNEYPNMTPEHIEELQKKAFELMKDVDSENDEKIQKMNELANQINKDDYFDEFADIHKEYPYLSLSECEKMENLLRVWYGYYNGEGGYEKDLKKAEQYNIEIEKLREQNEVNKMATQIISFAGKFLGSIFRKK